MSLAEQFHADHKARLVRLRAVPLAQAPILDARVRVELNDLQAKIERQQIIISDLNAIISKQRNIIRKFADDSESPTPRIIDVVAVVGEHYGFTRMMMIAAQKTAPVVMARQAGYFICRSLGYSWSEIGRGFHRDHTSIIHGERKMSAALKESPRLKDDIEQINIKLDQHIARRIALSKEALA